jgi:hypothetical protein
LASLPKDVYDAAPFYYNEKIFVCSGESSFAGKRYFTNFSIYCFVSSLGQAHPTQ